MHTPERPQPGDPAGALTVVSGSVDEIRSEKATWEQLGWHVAIARGSMMSTSADVLRELGVALEFPDYYGQNWDALDECWTDLDWLVEPTIGFRVVILDADLVFSATPDRWPWFFESAQSAADVWSRPAQWGRTWGSKLFQVVLQADSNDTTVQHRLTAFLTTRG